MILGFILVMGEFSFGHYKESLLRTYRAKLTSNLKNKKTYTLKFGVVESKL